MQILKKLIFIFFPTLAICQYQPIKIYESGDAFSGPCEPSIVVNPANPDNIIAGSVLNFFHYSNDGGKSWRTKTLNSSYGVWGDPCLIADNNGRIYYFHLSDPTGNNWKSDDMLDRIVCQYSNNGGRSWSSGSYMGFYHPKDQDKEWAAVSYKSNQLVCTWTQFDLYDSPDTANKSNILFSTSSNNGDTWSEAIRINQFSGNCLDNSGTTEGAVPCFGPRDEIYVAWSLDKKIYFDRSVDGGKTWLEKDIIVSDQPSGWSFAIPNFSRTNGMPVTACDVSEGPFKGTIYVCWGDKRTASGDADIWIARSMDKGNTWSEPIRVNDDKGTTDQFLPWMTVDPKTGFIYTVFYDRRNLNEGETNVYFAYSKDAGNTWVNEQLNAKTFITNGHAFMGDYTNISAYNGVVRPIWTEFHDGKLSVWTALINFDE